MNFNAQSFMQSEAARQLGQLVFDLIAANAEIQVRDEQIEQLKAELDAIQSKD